MTESIVIFLHIPKAAGSTLNRVIAQSYPPEAIHKIGGKTRSVELAEVAEVTRMPTAVRLLSGHSPFGVHTALSRPFTYIAMLRDPVERMLSHYYFAKRLATHPMHAAIASGEMTLTGFARKLSNTQTRYIAGSDLSEDEATLLERAKANLSEHFSVVGLSERFDESVVLFERVLGWRVRAFGNSNVTQGRPKADGHSSEELEAIRESNQLDLALYAHARERFEAQIAEQGAGFQAAVRWLQLRNRFGGFFGKLTSKASS